MAASKKENKGKCELCGREETELTVHHLTPKELGESFLPTALLCIACHKQIHAIYTNEELAARLSTVKELREDEKIRNFIKWIRKQPSGRLVRTKKAKERRRR
ncbi:HNH endonuclease [Bacillus sp. 1P06AnD]|uniref:HNH endonuclease n=1 Tax=Bacillus sp. 1P06AnD TaxID=3132208 RepID=UPI0039A10334